MGTPTSSNSTQSATAESKMAEFFSKGPQSNFTKMSKQFAQEQVIQQAVMDYAAEKEAEEQLRREHLMAQEVAAKGNNNDDDEEDWDALLEDDEISNKLMEQRFAELRGEAEEANSWKIKGHGVLSEIAEEEFLNTVTKSQYSIVHFYHREFPRSKIVDHHLEILAKKYIATKFVKLDAEKAPFFVTRLGVQMMPCVVMFTDGVMCGRIDGFDLLGGVDEFPTEVMECVLGASGAISFKPDGVDAERCHSIFDKQRMDIVGLNAQSKDSDSDE